MEAIVWLGIMIVLLIVEMATLGLTSIWFAGGALAAFIASLFHAPIWVEVLVFLVVSVALLFSTRPIAVNYLNRNKTKTNVNSMIGKEAIVTAEINNLRNSGQVVINGLEWTARAENTDETIPLQSVVEILKVDGVKLIVKRKEGTRLCG